MSHGVDMIVKDGLDVSSFFAYSSQKLRICVTPNKPNFVRNTLLCSLKGFGKDCGISVTSSVGFKKNGSNNRARFL